MIEGARRITDIKHLKQLPGFKLVAIEVAQKVRYERLVKRNENPGDAGKTFDQFVQDEKAEAESEIPTLMELADVTVDNNGSLENFYKQLDKLIA